MAEQNQPKEAGRPAGAPAQNPADTVEMTDVFGRPVRIPRATWKEQVLPNMLAQAGEDPERLAAAIVQCLQLGFALEVLPASFRLKELDPDVQRSHATVAALQRAVGDLKGSERTLRTLLEKRPASAPARVGLALLHQQRGEAAQVEAMLWEALQHEPDNADALHWYFRLQQERGADALSDAVQKVAALPGAWRARLWQARALLEQGQPAPAVAIYEDVLARVPEQSDALLMASGDLGQHRLHDEIARLVLPRFDINRHHPNIGVNLLQHFVETKQLEPGRKLLHELLLRFGPSLQNQVQRFTAEFDRMQAASLPPLQASGRVSLYRIDHPSWYAALRDPQWMLANKSPSSRVVVLPALAIEGGVPATGQEDELGRAARSVPLFLAEQIWLATPHRASTALPMTDGGGWAISNQPWPEAKLAEQLGDRERATAQLLSGVLRVEGERRRIDLWLYDVATKQRSAHLAAEGGQGELGKMCWQLTAELAPKLDGPADLKPQAGNDQFWDHYVQGLGQHAALLMATTGGMPKERLFGMRYILQWLASVIGEESRYQPAWWLFASGMCLDQQLGSLIHREFARVLVPLFQQSPPNSPFAWLCAAVLRTIGLPDVWRQRREQVLAAAPPPVKQWIAKAEA